MPDFPRSILAFQRQFADEAACASWLSAARWPEGFRCPACGHDRAWELGAKAWTYECAKCRRQTSVTAGTVMHGSKLAAHGMVLGGLSDGHPLEWPLRAADVAAAGPGILQECLAVVRQAASGHGQSSPRPLSGVVEVDETQVLYHTKDDPVTGGGGRSPDGKMQVCRCCRNRR